MYFVDLTDASEYMLKVRALYKNGFSEWSNVINVTTDWFNDTSDELLMIKICSLPNNLNFKGLKLYNEKINAMQWGLIQIK